MNLKRSKELLERAYKVIPSATQTFSKGPNQWVRGVAPHFLEMGEGAWVWDVDGNKFLDYLMALGPIILGYNNTEINAAIGAQLKKGIVFSQMNPLEVEVAEILSELIPCAEMVRFAKNGSDATSGAVRAARAYTGRDRIAYCGYHGWHDWYIGTTTRNLGVPKAVQELTHTFKYNDLPSLQEVFATHPGEIAAVIMEPVGVEAPANGFLEGVKQLAHTNGALLVFDEIVNVFRMSLGGAQAYFNVTPDMACFGKAMANGMPLAAVVGSRDVMEIFDKIFFSGTFGGETLSLAACRETINIMRRDDGIQHLWKVGERLVQGTKRLIGKHHLDESLVCVGYAPRSVLAFPHSDEQEARLRRSYFMQECIKQGLLFFGSQNPTMSHHDAEIDFTLDVYDKSMQKFADALSDNAFSNRLEGLCVEPIFRKA